MVGEIEGLRRTGASCTGGNCPGDGGGDREVTEPTYDRMRGMLRVWVEVDGVCVLSGVDEGRGQGD
jgi:hypothetical protein